MEKFSFTANFRYSAEPPILFIPGWGFDCRIVRLFDLLAGQNLLLPASFIDPRTFVDDLLIFLDNHKLPKINITGWSMGAHLALQCGLAMPGRVASLELYAIRKKWPEGEVEEIKGGVSSDLPGYMSGFYRKCFLGYKKCYADFVGTLQDDYLAGLDLETLLAGLDYLAGFVVPEMLPKDVPTKIIHGRKDVVTPVAEMVTFSGACQEIVDNAGHMVLLNTLR